MTRKHVFWSAMALMLWTVMLSCGGSDDGGGTTPVTPDPGKKDTTVVPPKPVATAKPRFAWVDAAANFPRFANSKENITTDLTRLHDAGFTGVIVDVRPSEGDVLFRSTHADAVTKLDYWTNDGQYRFCERTATWDYLQAFIDAGHALGMKVYAALNTFTGGCLYPYGLGKQGLVFRDASKRQWVTVLNMPSGPTNEMDLTGTDPSKSDFYGTKFLNPAKDEVQQYVLNIIKDVCQYDIDGIVLDRCRYDDLLSDFSDVSREKFEQYLGRTGIDLQADVLPAGTKSAPAVAPRFFRQWIAFRAKVIHDFMKRVADTVHGVRSSIQVCAYVGAWYSEYYTMGVNWASKGYDPSTLYPEWANADYHQYGYADLMDFMFLGCYATADQIYGSTEWTMQGFCRLGRQKLGSTPFAGGPDIGNADGFTKGHAATAVTQSVDACINASDGYFVFDLCHIRQYDYWSALKQGIDSYLSTLK